MGFVFGIGILIGLITRSLFIMADTHSAQEGFRYKCYQVDSLESVIQRYGATVQYIDLDQRLYTPYDGHIIVKHYENVVTQPYGDSAYFSLFMTLRLIN
jgi:hypothetical protein